MASSPSEDGGLGLEIDPNGPSIETLTENKPETDIIGVSGSNVVEGSQKDELRDSVVDGKDFMKDDSFVAEESNGNKETDGDLGSVAQEGDQNSKLEGEEQNVQAGEQKELENDQHACYYIITQKEKTGFSVDDLVWGKIKSHPWWPGQIFDLQYASEMALKRQKKDHFLVAYFDKTFAWVPVSQLKPFQTHFSELEKQSCMESFVNAVHAVLKEVSRRVELGMACHCLADETYANLKHKKVENAGIQEGTCSSAVDRSLFVNAFQPESLLAYVWVLARCPLGGFNRLDLTIATAHLRTFYRSKGYPELPIFVFADGLVENDAEIPLSKSKVSGELKADSLTPVASSIESGKRPRGRPPKKQILEDDYEQKGLSKLKEEKYVHHLASLTAIASSIKSGKKPRGRPRKNHIYEDSSDQMEEEVIDYPSRVSGKKRKVVDSESADVGRSKKGMVSKYVDSETKAPSSTRSRSLRVGDRISRIACQLKESPAISRKCADLSFKAAEKNEIASQDYSSPSEMLAQLCIIAIDPMNEYSFLPMIVSFFTKFRAYLTSTSEDQEPEKPMGRTRDRKKKVQYTESDSSEMSEPDYMQDSYWSDIILQSSPEREPVSRGRKRKGASKKGQKKKLKPAGESLLSDPVDPLLDTEHIQLVGASNPNEKQEMKGEIIGNAEEKMKEEEPTVLILSFNESDALPSASELNKIFRPYGPLREEETKVLRKTNHAKVVFRYRDDAEKAFSSAVKYSVFGPALVSYRLRYSPSPKSSPAGSPHEKNGDSPAKDELQAQEGTEADMDNI